jgi:hypothetical protein
MALSDARPASTVRRCEPLSWRGALALWLGLSGLFWSAAALVLWRL